MPGIRIQHPTDHDTTFILMDASRPYHQPIRCGVCYGAPVHTFKTYHLDLDSAGACIVSTEIVERLKRIPNQPFLFANEVANPPNQKVVVGATLL